MFWGLLSKPEMQKVFPRNEGHSGRSQTLWVKHPSVVPLRAMMEVCRLIYIYFIKWTSSRRDAEKLRESYQRKKRSLLLWRLSLKLAAGVIFLALCGKTLLSRLQMLLQTLPCAPGSS